LIGRFYLLGKHDPFGTPVSTFPDHALGGRSESIPGIFAQDAYELAKLA
jgi:hypothetical protein